MYRNQTGQSVWSDCSLSKPNGCGVQLASTSSYGQGLNVFGGGVYAVEWIDEWIKIWSFPRTLAPLDMLTDNPIPANWGIPSAFYPFGSNCSSSNFKNHKIIINLTFCGDWAGKNYLTSCAALTNVSTCPAYVQSAPQAFLDSYWSLNSIKVYE
jgi:hypothetical protein